MTRKKVANFNLHNLNADGINSVRPHFNFSSSTAEATQFSLPKFQYDVPKVGCRTFGAITVQHQNVHQIDDMNVFYAAMGYDTNARESGFAEEVFIWERYMRDGAKMSKHCFQMQIATYLNKHAAKFFERYRQAYDAMLQKCDSVMVDGADPHCANCPMHPLVAVEVTK
jgi:hypothetical protein